MNFGSIEINPCKWVSIDIYFSDPNFRGGEGGSSKSVDRIHTFSFIDDALNYEYECNCLVVDWLPKLFK